MNDSNDDHQQFFDSQVFAIVEDKKEIKQNQSSSLQSIS